MVKISVLAYAMVTGLVLRGESAQAGVRWSKGLRVGDRPAIGDAFRLLNEVEHKLQAHLQTNAQIMAAAAAAYKTEDEDEYEGFCCKNGCRTSDDTPQECNKGKGKSWSLKECNGCR